ncbi:MAG: FecR domain-containing protein [Rudaea sp.]
MAIAFFPTMIFIGAVVDYSRANSYKTAINAALDAALLSGGRHGNSGWAEIALDTFNAKLSSKYSLRAKPTFIQDSSTGNYVASVTSSWPTSVLGIINIGSIGVTVAASAVADRDNAFILNRDRIPPESHVWSVSDLSGDAFLTPSAGEQTPLWEGAILNPGYNIRTGQNGRVLLVRDQETILIAPNSVVGIPTHATEGISTTIDQWAGSIVLAVAKRNYVHFEVDTPYLAAVVRGTRFRVTVNKDAASVNVLRGQVEVTDFKSGQFVIVKPGQAAEVSAQGTVGPSLSGTGILNPIRQGSPRISSLRPTALSSQPLSAQGGTSDERKSPMLSDAENKWPGALGRFFSNPADQRTNAILYVILAGVLGAAAGTAANWLRLRRKQGST